jgi:hypothetical protein
MKFNQRASLKYALSWDQDCIFIHADCAPNKYLNPRPTAIPWTEIRTAYACEPVDRTNIYDIEFKARKCAMYVDDMIVAEGLA